MIGTNKMRDPRTRATVNNRIAKTSVTTLAIISLFAQVREAVSKSSKAVFEIESALPTVSQ